MIRKDTIKETTARFFVFLLGLTLAITPSCSRREQSPAEAIEEKTALGRKYIEEGRLLEAITLFKQQTESSPESWIAWQSLGHAYELRGNKFNEALSAYRKALELHPGNPNDTLAMKRMMGLRTSAQIETSYQTIFAPGDSTGLKGPYLGQPTPGLTPKVFAPGIVSTKGGFEYVCSVSANGNELYFQRNKKIQVCRLENGGWTAPEDAPFTEEYPGSEAHLSTSNNRLFYVRQGEKGPEIWKLDFFPSGWEPPVRLFPGQFISTTSSGDLYTSAVMDEGDGGQIACAQWDGESFRSPARLKGEINSPFGDTHPCVSADGRTIIFDSTRPGGKGWSDFYVSFRKKDGTWGKAVHLESISTDGNDICATLSPDGRFLFFTNNLDIYWVSTGVLDRLKASYSQR